MWKYSFTPTVVDDCAYLILRINFKFNSGLNWDKHQQRAYRLRVADGIEAIWNDHFCLVKPGIKYPCRVKIWFSEPYDQIVLVRPGTGRTNMRDWYSADTSGYHAHEVGHMLGLMDEYPGGFVRADTIFTATGLMGSGSHNPMPAMPPRYYDPWVEGFPGYTLERYDGNSKRKKIKPDSQGKDVKGSKRDLESSK